MIDQIINIDCLLGLRKLSSESVDLTVTSPPYDDLREYNGKIEQWSFDKFQEIAKELFRVTVPGGVIVWIVNDASKNGSESGTSFRQALFFKECGFRLHDTMIWYKDSFSFPEKTKYRQCFEYMFVLSKGKPSHINLIADRKNKWSGTKIHGTSRKVNGSTHRKSNDKKSIVSEHGVRFNVWEIPTEKANKTGHPAVFPQQLVRDHILSWSNAGDTVLDPFMGSGTTALAAIETGRHYVGFEIDTEYYDICQARVIQAEEERRKKLFFLLGGDSCG